MRCTTVNTWRSGNAWFTCDRCSQRWRRGDMLTEWTNLRVCPVCIDPRPPQMMPPNVYPEGIPFFDARPPQDNPDRLSDDTYLHPATGGIFAPNGGPPLMPNGQTLPIGALSPKELIENPVPYIDPYLLDDSDTFVNADDDGLFDTGVIGPPPPLPPIPTIPGQTTATGANVIQDDITFKTGVIPAPTVPGAG